MLRLKAKQKVRAIFLAFFLLLLNFNFVTAQNFSNPNDEYYKNQWYLKKIGAAYTWNYELRGDYPVIAIIDSGIDIDHPDLYKNIWFNDLETENGLDDDRNGFIDDVFGWNFVENIPNPRPVLSSTSSDDGLNHGTMIAGIIAANTNNELGISGIANKSKIMALRALNEKGEGKINDVIRAIDYAVNNGADIINLSFSGSDYNQGFEDAIKRASRAGVIIVSAVGNDNFNLNKNSSYPACFDFYDSPGLVLGVSALDSMDQKAAFSSYGSRCVDISAPGISFFSTSFYDSENNKYLEYQGYWSGTSMASAVVSGTLGLIKQINPKLDQKELLEILLKSSDNVNNLNSPFDNQLGVGRVNALYSARWADEKWQNLTGMFLLYPQSEVKNYQSENNFYSLSISNHKGKISNSFSIYDEAFRGGVNLAVGDIDGDGVSEIVTGAGVGGGPHVRIFDIKGNLKGQFFAYDEKFRGGVNLAVGDIDGDGVSEIVTGAGFGGGPHVRIFDNQAKLKGQFFAYENDFYGGIKVAVANLYGQKTKNKKEIIISPGAGRLSEIKIFDSFGKERKKIMAYGENFKGGVNLSISDLNKDGIDEIICGAGPGGAPHVRTFNVKGELLSSFYAFDENFSGGVSVSYIEAYN